MSEEVKELVAKELAGIKENQDKFQNDNSEELKGVKEQLKQAEESLIELNRANEAIQSVPKTEREKLSLIGKAFLSQGDSDHRVELSDSEEKALSPYFTADGGYFDVQQMIEGIESCQLDYGCIRSNADVRRVTSSQLTWMEQEEERKPTFAELLEMETTKNGCCDPCGDSTDPAKLLRRTASLTPYSRVNCVPRALVDNNTGFDVLGSWLLPWISKEFRYLEDAKGFATLFNNNFLLEHSITSSAFTGLTIQDLVDLRGVAGLENCGTDASLWIHCSNTHQLLSEKDTQGRYMLETIAMLLGNNINSTKDSWFNYCSILPTANESAADTKFAFYGNLREQLTMFERGGFQIATTDQHNFPCDVITVRVTEEIGFATKGEQCSKSGVLVKTAP